MNTWHYPIILIIFQLISAIVIPLLYSWKIRIAHLYIIFSAVLSNILAIMTLRMIILFGPYTYQLGGWPGNLGIEVKFDYLSGFVLILITVIYLPLMVYSLYSDRVELSQTYLGWYYSLLFLLGASMSGMAMANDIFNLYVFMEISLIASAAIVAVKGTPEAIKASFKYLVLNVISSGSILLSIGMFYQTTGYLNIPLIAANLGLAFQNYPQVLTAAIGLMIFGFSLKAAIFPLHVWLPDAHSSAPTTSSALLSGLLIKIYLVALARVIYLTIYPTIIDYIPLKFIMSSMAIMAILAGSFFAITQEDIKRMLAYSSIAQIGYIVLGISLFTVSGLKGAFLHLANHAFMKTTLFLAAGNVIHKTGIRNIKDFKGLGKKMPITFTAFILAALSMIGIPPFSGFFSKWYLALGSLEAGKPIFVVVIITSSLLNAYYYLPVIIKAFFYQPDRELLDVHEGNLFSTIPVVFTGAGCLLLGLGVDRVLIVVGKIAEMLLIGG